MRGSSLPLQGLLQYTHQNIYTAVGECVVLHASIEIGYWGSIAGSAIHSSWHQNVDLKCAIHFSLTPIRLPQYSATWTVNMLFQVVLQGIPECRNWVCKFFLSFLLDYRWMLCLIIQEVY